MEQINFGSDAPTRVDDLSEETDSEISGVSKFGFHEVILNDSSELETNPNQLFLLSNASVLPHYYLDTKEDILSFSPPPEPWTSPSTFRTTKSNSLERYSFYRGSDKCSSKSSSINSYCSKTLSNSNGTSWWTKSRNLKETKYHPCRLFNHLMSIKSSRPCQLKLLQVTSAFLAIIAILCILVKSSNKDNNRISNSQENIEPVKFNFESWITNANEDENITSNKLLDLQNFHFLLNNVSKCANGANNFSNFEEIYFMILVHSAPGNFEERQAIRSTWGSLEEIEGLLIRRIFLLGTSESDNSLVQRESLLYGDIVIGSFIDSYKNLTYKHLMGYKWSLTYCPNATFILKTDDDAFIDVFSLMDFMKRTFSQRPKNTLICNVMPEGTRPVRFSDDDVGSFGGGSVNKSEPQKGKWSVTRKEYFYETYPKYCSGLGYLATMDVLKDFYKISLRVKYLWIDDVFVTGIIRELAKIEPFYLNLRYLYEPQKYRKWLNGTKILGKRNMKSIENVGPGRKMRLPFTFIHLERGNYLNEDMKELWNKIGRD